MTTMMMTIMVTLEPAKVVGNIWSEFFLVQGRLVVWCNCLEMWSFVPILSCSDSMLGLSVKSGCKLWRRREQALFFQNIGDPHPPTHVSKKETVCDCVQRKLESWEPKKWKLHLRWCRRGWCPHRPSRSTWNKYLINLWTPAPRMWSLFFKAK